MTAPSFDGAAIGGVASGTNTKTVTGLNTSVPNTVVLVAVGYELGAAARDVTGITSTSGLVFNRRKKVLNAGQNNQTVELWWAPAAAILSGDAVTITWDANFDDAGVVIGAVKGCGDISNPWDPDASLPAGENSGSRPSPVYSTTDPETLAIGVFGAVDNIGGYGPSSGWSNFGFAGTSLGILAETCAMDYKAHATAQSGVSYVPGSADQGAAIADALTATSPTPPPSHAFNIVQSKTVVGPGTNPSGASGFGLDSAPTVGNLVVCFLGVNIARTSLVINTAFWTVGKYQVAETGDNLVQVVLYRYVQSGDTSALAAPVTAGSTYWAWSLVEIDGVTGVWEDDVLAGFGRSRVNDLVMAQVICPADDCLVVCGVNNYNGSTNPAITGATNTWTVEGAANNSSNYGSVGLFSLYADDGTVIDGTADVNTNDPSAYVFLILSPTRPTVPYIAGVVAHCQFDPRNDLVAPRVPDSRNFLIVVQWRDRGDGAWTPTPTGTWSQFASLLNGSNYHAGAFYRAVESGDADGIIAPVFTTDPGSFKLTQVIEVGGMADFAAALVGIDTGRATSGPTITTGAIVTDGPDQLAVIAVGEYNQAAFPVYSGGVTWEIQDQGTDGGSNYGAWSVASHRYPSGGSSVSQTVNRPGDTTGYVMFLLGEAGETSSGESSPSSGGPDLAPARATQAARMVVEEGDADVRTTQVVRLLPSSIAPPVRTTREARLVVADVVVTPRITQAFRLTVAAGVACVTKWCQCWRITRRDGVIFRFTSLDVDFLWGSEVFKSCGSLLPSASEDSSQVGAVSNQELKGIFSDEGIEAAELFGGLFDDAYVEVWLVAWEGPEAPRLLASGWTGNLQHQEGTFNMEVVGPGAKIDQQALVQNYGPGCRWVFGSAACGYDREAVKRTGAVTAAFNRGNFIATVDLDDGGLQWADGLVRWTSGANDGIETEVKEAVFDGGGNVAVELWDLVGLAIEPGDTFELLPGCDLSFATCKGVYNNAINFGGFKDVPGEDSVVQTPDAKLS